MILYPLLISVIVMMASLVGVVFVWKQAGRLIENNLAYLVSFSAGVFLVVSYSLFTEVLEISSSAVAGITWVAIGSLSILVIFKFLPHFHHHHDEQQEEPHSHSDIDARRILISDGLHNIGDGILIAASFAVSPVVGFIAGISIFVHELVQEVSEFFVLRQAGFSVKKALTLNFLVSGTILVGAIGGSLLLDSFEAFEAPLLGLAAGSFFIVVVHDLIPHSIRNSKGKTLYLKHIAWFLFGLVIMFSVGLLAGHPEPDGHGHNIPDSHQSYTDFA